MPAPQKSMLYNAAKTNFSAKQIPLPTDWEQPNEQFPDAFPASELSVAPNSPTNLFRDATLNKNHVDTAKQIGDKLDAYIEGMCGAICSGIDNWMKVAAVTGVVINGPVGVLPPGGVVGPPLNALIMATAPKSTPQETKYSNAIANALGTLWQAWHMGITGTLAYPAFAAVPSPVAPPAPNVPMPLIALPSPGEAGLAPASLKGLMLTNLADPSALHASDLFDAIAQAFYTVFQTFKSSTMVQNVLGTGPVPTFAPPLVPVGPVVMGVGNGPPGTCIK
jgi:hypothetical protein